MSDTIRNQRKATQTGLPETMHLTLAGLCGLALLVVAVAAALVLVYKETGQGGSASSSLADGSVAHSSPVLSLGIGILGGGFALVLAAIGGLLLLVRSLGLADQTSALALPNGSVRALLALGLVIIFLTAAAWLMSNSGSDEGKQILTIASTALSTVIGFYFGSNAATDGVAAGQNQTKTPDNDASPEAPPPDPERLVQSITTIRSLAGGARAKLEQLGHGPTPDQLAAEIPPLDTKGAEALTRLRDARQRMASKAAALATDADRGAAALSDIRTASNDTTKLGAIATRIEQLSKDSENANHDFEAATNDFIAARDSILSGVAKG